MWYHYHHVWDKARLWIFCHETDFTQIWLFCLRLDDLPGQSAVIDLRDSVTKHLVRAQDCRSRGPGFESCGQHFASELWQFLLPHFINWCLSEIRRRHKKSRRSLLSGVYASESKRSTHGVNTCVTCRGLQNSKMNHSRVSPIMGCLEFIPVPRT